MFVARVPTNIVCSLRFQRRLIFMRKEDEKEEKMGAFVTDTHIGGQVEPNFTINNSNETLNNNT